MKTFVIILYAASALCFVAGSVIIGRQYEDVKVKLRQKEAEIARLKLENEVMQVGTANWIVEHSELKGD
jgi:hypothetical protein